MAIDATRLRRGVQNSVNHQRTPIQSCPSPQPFTPPLSEPLPLLYPHPSS